LFLEDVVQTLQYLGLSINQAKVYLAISSTKFLSVKEIKQKSNVPRQDIYRILESLTDLGLVEC
jgi:sugar-specific transcriptional regulator TrmB